LCCHVDVCFFAGTVLFHSTIIAHIKVTFSLSKENSETFNFLGLKVEQNNGGVIINQNSYIDYIKPISIKNQTCTIRLLSIPERRLLKSLVGQIQWTAKQTRPDVAYTACDLSTRIKNSTVADIKRANKQLKQMQENKVNLLIADTGSLEFSSLLLFCDASHGNLSGGGSQGGFVIFLQGSNDNLSPPLIWRSHKLKRVVKSAMGAETMALLEGAEYVMLIKTIIKEITLIDLPIICISDNKSVVDAINSTSVLEDKRLYIDICALRQMIERKELNRIILTTSQNQLADCLTKATASSQKLIQVLSGEEIYKLPSND